MLGEYKLFISLLNNNIDCNLLLTEIIKANADKDIEMSFVSTD